MKIMAAAAAFLAAAAVAPAQEAKPLTITGSLAPRTQFDLSEGTGYANLSSGPGGAAFLRFADKLDKYSNLVIKVGTPYLDNKSGTAYNSTSAPASAGIATNSWISGVGVQEAYASTDILGELGMADVVGLKLQAGMFRLKAPVFSRGLNFGFGTGEDFSRSEIYSNYTFSIPGASYESYKWSVEVPVNALKDVFPVSVKVGSDLDLTGKGEKTGFTGYAEVGGRNLYLLDDKFVVDWVAYGTLKARDSAPTGVAYIDNGKILGGEVSVGFGFDNGLSVGLGGAADYALYSYSAGWSGTTVKSYTDEGSLNWQAGLDLTQKDLLKLAGAYVHRNLFDLDTDTAAGSQVPVNYAQNFAAFRLDVLAVKNLTPYAGGTYVVSYDTVKDEKTKKIRTAAPSNSTPLAWEAGLVWKLTTAIDLTCGYTKGDNNLVSNFPPTVNAIVPSANGAVFFKAGFKF
jgi:hypothetical protein